RRSSDLRFGLVIQIFKQDGGFGRDRLSQNCVFVPRCHFRQSKYVFSRHCAADKDLPESLQAFGSLARAHAKIREFPIDIRRIWRELYRLGESAHRLVAVSSPVVRHSQVRPEMRVLRSEEHTSEL